MLQTMLQTMTPMQANEPTEFGDRYRTLTCPLNLAYPTRDSGIDNTFPSVTLS
jgi:hypothetical protein